MFRLFPESRTAKCALIGYQRDAGLKIPIEHVRRITGVRRNPATDGTARDPVAVAFGPRLLTAFAAPNLAPRICAALLRETYLLTRHPRPCSIGRLIIKPNCRSAAR